MVTTYSLSSTCSFKFRAALLVTPQHRSKTRLVSDSTTSIWEQCLILIDPSENKWPFSALYERFRTESIFNLDLNSIDRLLPTSSNGQLYATKFYISRSRWGGRHKFSLPMEVSCIFHADACLWKNPTQWFPSPLCSSVAMYMFSGSERDCIASLDVPWANPDGWVRERNELPILKHNSFIQELLDVGK